MTMNEVLQAWDLCQMDATENFCPCDQCPMMENGCDRNDRFIPVPECLMREMSDMLKPGSEWTYIGRARNVQ